MFSINWCICVHHEPAHVSGDGVVPYGTGGVPPFGYYVPIGLSFHALGGLAWRMQDYKGIVDLANACYGN